MFMNTKCILIDSAAFVLLGRVATLVFVDCLLRASSPNVPRTSVANSGSRKGKFTHGCRETVKQTRGCFVQAGDTETSNYYYWGSESVGTKDRWNLFPLSSSHSPSLADPTSTHPSAWETVFGRESMRWGGRDGGWGAPTKQLFHLLANIYTALVSFAYCWWHSFCSFTRSSILVRSYFSLGLFTISMVVFPNLV